VLFIASADQPVGRAEIDFLVEIRRYADRVVCLLNKADHLSEAELREVLAFTTRVVHGALQATVPLVPFSARLACTDDGHGSPASLRNGALTELEHRLRTLLGEERCAVWIASITRALDRILRQAELAIGLELQARSAPLAQIEANLAVFTAKKEETQQATSDNDVLYCAAVKRLQKSEIEPALSSFSAALQDEMRGLCMRRCVDGGAMPLRRLQADVEAAFIQQIRNAFDGWRAAHDAELAHSLDRLCERFWSQNQEIVDELLRASATLFSLPFEPTKTRSDWQPQPEFRYNFWSEPTGLSMLGASLVPLLPRFIGAPVVRRRLTEHAVELVDKQAGRVRHDFEQRLRETALVFRREMHGRTQATIDAIEHAITAGVSQRERGEEEAAARQRILEADLAAIVAVETRIGALSR